MSPLEILYRDEHLIAINKPHGLLVHRSKLARDADVFAIQELRNQINQHVYPAHRLDRKTSGVLLFTLDKLSDSAMQQMFAQGKVHKTYLAIVRGYTPIEETINYPLRKENGRMQEAITNYQTLAQAEINLASLRHSTSRYSLVKVKPETGRMHQIRRHFAHIFHPIIGDRPHGCNKQNKLFKETYNMSTMMLHAHEMQFTHPILGTEIRLKANYSEEFKRMLEVIFNESTYTL